MPHITIIGAGQAGLQLGLTLLQQGYSVTLVSDRTAAEIRNGSVLSTQCLFGTSLQIEGELGLDFWAEECPDIEGVVFNVAGPDGNKALAWSARFDKPAQSVDQRLKISELLQRFIERGGNLIHQKATLQD
ncbi:MAG TPA: hypothetical protein VKU00_14070, partial [Chthonomonadaceae bacterium]|nr:hypothetical protein [Chthonomonadaceae bacterium]